MRHTIELTDNDIQELNSTVNYTTNIQPIRSIIYYMLRQIQPNTNINHEQDMYKTELFSNEFAQTNEYRIK